MSNGLTPERRVNKLGHVVTKHVRSAVTGPVAVNLPMVVSSLGDRPEKVSALTERFYDRYSANLDYSIQQGRLFKDKINAVLSEFSDRSLSRLENAQTSGDGPLAGLLLEKHDECTINDFLAVMSIMERDRMTSSDIESHLWSLHECKELVPQGEDGEYPVERGEQSLALVKVMRHLLWEQPDSLALLCGEQGMQYPVMNDDKLRKLVTGADREVIVQLILDRNIVDPEQLMELSSSSHASLVQGNL